MKKNFQQMVSGAIVSVLSIASLTACGGGGQANNPSSQAKETQSQGTQAQTPAKIDTSKKVDLVFLFVGDEPSGKKEVLDAVNQALEKKLNATMQIQCTTWTDWQQKYNLAFTSGQQLDLVYASSWTNYGSMAKSGAFFELDDLYPVYAPELYELEKPYFDQCKVNGKIYTIPGIKEEWPCNGYEYREDLRKKYNLPVPNSVENVEAYLLGIKKNLPEQGLMTPSVYTTSLSNAFSVAGYLCGMKYGYLSMKYGLISLANEPSKLWDYWYSDDFREDMKTMKRWADNGFWSKSSLSNTNEGTYTSELSVIRHEGLNMDKYAGDVKVIKEAGLNWETVFIPYADLTGVACPGPAMQNGTAIASSSKNPERAMMVMNYLMTDKEMNALFQCGVKGVHYNIDDKGLYQAVENTTFPREGFNSWNLRSKGISIEVAEDAIIDMEGIKNHLREISSKMKYPNTNITAAFSEDYNDYSAERSAVSTVIQQYLAPIQAGFVDDVDAAIDEFLKKAEEAGLKKIREGYTKQWQDYCTEYNYQ